MNFDLESLIRPLDGYDKNMPGYDHRKGWNDAIMHVMDLHRSTTAEPTGTIERSGEYYKQWLANKGSEEAVPLTATPTSAEREKAKRAFLAGWMRYDTASDADTQRAHAEFDAWWPEKTPV